MLERLKLRVILWFFYVLGAVHRRLFPDPLADFFTEMEKSGRLKIKDDLKRPLIERRSSRQTRMRREQ